MDDWYWGVIAISVIPNATIAVTTPATITIHIFDNSILMICIISISTSSLLSCLIFVSILSPILCALNTYSGVYYSVQLYEPCIIMSTRPTSISFFD